MVVVALAGAALYAPAYAARAATGPGEPVDFLRHPQDGWRFLAAVVPGASGARLATPSAAAGRARAVFAGSSVEPTRVSLLYLPDHRLEVGRGKGRTTLTAKAELLWRIVGRLRPGGALRTVGLMDFDTGALIYDVRRGA